MCFLSVLVLKTYWSKCYNGIVLSNSFSCKLTVVHTRLRHDYLNLVRKNVTHFLNHSPRWREHWWTDCLCIIGAVCITLPKPIDLSLCWSHQEKGCSVAIQIFPRVQSSCFCLWMTGPETPSFTFFPLQSLSFPQPKPRDWQWMASITGSRLSGSACLILSLLRLPHRAELSQVQGGG